MTVIHLLASSADRCNLTGGETRTPLHGGISIPRAAGLPQGAHRMTEPDISAEIKAHTRRIARERQPNRAGRRPKPPPAPSLVRPLAYSPERAAELIGISRRLLYQIIARGELTARKCGRLTLIADADLCAYVEALPQLDLSK
jgi:excisionase family DNA binding protein